MKSFIALIQVDNDSADSKGVKETLDQLVSDVGADNDIEFFAVTEVPNGWMGGELPALGMWLAKPDKFEV